MALIAILMSVNFTACSSDDEPETNTESKEKKLVKIKQGSHVAYFSYDDNNRLKQMKRVLYDGTREEYTAYSWGDTYIQGDSYFFKLNNKLVTESDNGYGICTYYQYNASNQLTKTTDTWGDSNKEDFTYTWENGNVVEKVSEDRGNPILIEYSNLTCKGYFPLMAPTLYYTVTCSPTYYDEDFGLFIAHPEMGGLRTKQLPNKITQPGYYTWLLQYTFSNDGYIETCTITTQYYNGDEYENIVTFTWE